jgi:hypothetical protein
MASAPEEPVPEPVTQRKRADGGRFHLQVDRQTKASYATYEAEKAGLEIKKEYPILQVAIYDGVREQDYRIVVIMIRDVVCTENVSLPKTSSRSKERRATRWTS